MFPLHREGGVARGAGAARPRSQAAQGAASRGAVGSSQGASRGGAGLDRRGRSIGHLHPARVGTRPTSYLWLPVKYTIDIL